MGNNINFYSLLIISGLAFVLPMLVSKIKRVKIPVVIAELLAGIIIGKSGFNIIQDDLWIEFLSLFGFAYLMFLSGVEIDFSYIKTLKNEKSGKGNPLFLGILIYLLTLLLSFAISYLLTKIGLAKNPLFLTLIFSTTSLGIVVPILKENKLINEPVGQTILISALIADFASMLLIPVVMFIVRSEGSIKLLTSLIVFVVFALIYFISKRFFKIDFDSNPTYESSQIKIRAAFALILFFVSLAEFSDVEIILGAFLAGILFSLLFHEFRTELVPKLDAIGYGFLIPIFFITVGADFDLKTVLKLDTLIALPLYLAIAYVVKLIPTLILKKYFSWRETLGAGFLLSSRLSLIIAIALVALEAEIINETTYSTFILVAIFTCVVSPIVFSKIFPHYQKKKEGIIIAGNNKIVASLVNKINLDNKQLILADIGEDSLFKLAESGTEYTYWSEFKSENIVSMENTEVKMFISAYERDDHNQLACTKAKQVGIEKIVAIINDPKVSYELDKQGIRTVTPMKAMYTLLYAFIKYPESFETLYSPEDNDNIDIREIKLIWQDVIGSKLRDLKLPGDCLVLMVSRDGRRIVPDGNTILEKGDIIVVLGSKEYMEEIEDVFI